MKRSTSRRKKIEKQIESNWSKVSYDNLKYVRKLFKKIGDVTFDRLKDEIIKNPMVINKELAYNEVTTIQLLCKESYDNYFIESESLSNFLKNNEIKETYFEDIKEVIKEKRTFDNDFNSIFFTGAIYTKTEKRTIFFNLTLDYENKNPYLCCCNGDDVSNLPLFGDKKNRSNLKSDSYHSTMMKIVLNLLFYMSAFPENVLNGPPDEVLDKLNKDNSKTISLSKDIADYLHENRDVSPHLRRGHFRYLASDRFKNKQFQTVFVKSSFVKGEAKTIINNGALI